MFTLPQHQPLASLVESYRFWDVVVLWARERLEHEDIVAAVLARGVVCDGLRLQSIDPNWLRGDDTALEFKGLPHVGFRAASDSPMCILRAGTLEHLLRVVRTGERASRELLADEFIRRDDFCRWAESQRVVLPFFWFAHGNASCSEADH